MRQIRLHDTASGELRELEPRDPGRVGIYACGPTVYDAIHVGNARPFVVYSLLKRFLQHEGYAVTLVVNVTDVNDKIYDAARPRGVPSAQLAAEMTQRYLDDTGSLGLGRPDVEPLASTSIEPIVALIADLLERDAAYAVDGDVYFRVRADGRYGSLSHRDLDDMDQGEGLEGASRKEDPLDFALWKAQKPGEDASWDAPWGAGRPGWHIECSAMAEEALGVGFDIHGGGNDLVFPHHENEAAQTRAARGAELATIWMHNGMLQLGGEKMAKSVGNIARLGELVAERGRDAVVLLLASGHYRGPLQLSEETLDGAAASARRLRELGDALVEGSSPAWSAELKEAFFAALAEDFNTPLALRHAYEWAARARGAEEPVGADDLREMLWVLGLDGLLEGFRGVQAPPEVLALLERRAEARAQRDFARSDALRDEIAAAGWVVRDGADGQTLVPAAS